MTTKYLDHGLYASIGATPTWGVAQDGDGTAIGASTPATVSIDLSAATAAAGATISIMGSGALTCVTSGATTNQFNAGSGATLVANLVAAINRSTNTIAVLGQATGWKTPLVQNTVFARVGSPTTTLEIMTRAGSAQYNSSTVATAGFTGGTFGPYALSGGAGGAWGWVLNTSAAFGSALAICTYGAWCQNGVIAGVFSGGDLVYVRSGKTITLGASNYSCIFTTGMGSEFNPVRFRIDRSEQWSDGTDPVFEIRQALDGNGNTFTFGAIYSTSYVTIEGKRISTGNYTFKITGRSSYQVLNGGAKLFVNGPMTITACKVANTNNGPTGFQTTSSATDNKQTTFLNDVYFAWDNLSPIISSGNGKQSHVILNGCTFDNTGNTVLHTSIFTAEQYAPTIYTFNGCRFVAFVAGSKLFSQPAQAYGQQVQLIFSDCDFGGTVTDRGPVMQYNGSTYYHTQTKYIAIDDRLGKNEFALDTVIGFIEWNASRSQPTLNALLQDGTEWSVRVVPSSTANMAGVSRPIVLPDFAKRNTLGSNTLRIKLEFLAEKSFVLTPAMVSVIAYYKGSNGTTNAVDSLAQQVMPVNSSESWSQMITDPDDSVLRPTYVSGATIYFNRYSLTVDTPTAVMDDTDVTMLVMVRAITSNATKMFFFDPELVMTVV